MSKIELNRVGIIRKSNHANEIGWYITMQDDTEISGGYKIFTSNNPDFEMDSSNKEKILYDGWVEQYDSLANYWNREIEWTDDYITIEWPNDKGPWRWKRL